MAELTPLYALAEKMRWRPTEGFTVQDCELVRAAAEVVALANHYHDCDAHRDGTLASICLMCEKLAACDKISKGETP